MRPVLFSKENFAFGKKLPSSIVRTEVYILPNLVKQWKINLQYTCRYFSGNKIYENMMGGARDTCGGQERCLQGFGRKA